MIASCPGFKSDSFIKKAAAKLNPAELHLLTIYEIMPTMHSKVNFFFDGVSVNIKKRSKLKKFIEYIFRQEGVELASINYIYCSDKRLLKINQQYLKHDELTDIITFDLSEPDGVIVAEVYVSTDRVRENASSQNQTITRELCRVVFHGALHLCGYSDKTAFEKEEMRNAEDRYLDLYFR